MTTNEPVRIRPLEAGDKEQWLHLWQGYLTFYHSVVSDEVKETTFARLLGDDPQDFSGLVADQSGTLVGLTHYVFHRHCWKVENVCYLQDLYAAPSARGMGVGRKLVEAVYAAADAEECPTVYWMTQQDNQTARQLYDRIADQTSFIKYQRPA